VGSSKRRLILYTAAKASCIGRRNPNRHEPALTVPCNRWMRRTRLASQLLARKSIDKLIRDSEEPEHALKKTLGPWSLTALGIGPSLARASSRLLAPRFQGAVRHYQHRQHAVGELPHHPHRTGWPSWRRSAIAISLVLVAFVCALTVSVTPNWHP